MVDSILWPVCSGKTAEAASADGSLFGAGIGRKIDFAPPPPIKSSFKVVSPPAEPC